MRDDFAVFILSHGRADDVATYNTLISQNYTGKIYILLDNEDDTEYKYRENFGDDCIVVFDKQKYFESIDKMDISDVRKVILFARCAVFDAARDKGVKYFLMLDDDYTRIEYKTLMGDVLKTYTCNHLDEVFTAMIEFLISSNALTIAFAQGGDFIGGAEGGAVKKKILRKAMNSFFCCTDRYVDFRGTFNEDVNMYTTLGNRGELIMSYTDVSIVQRTTQGTAGGMTEAYKDKGTYTKSFYTIMCAPSCAKIATMGDKHFRIHHKINWNNCTPMILNEKWKKSR